MLSKDKTAEPRTQISDSILRSQQIFGVDADGWKAGAPLVVDGDVLGYPVESLAAIPPGTYQVQALLHRYETFRRADGHVVKLPMDRGEGQQWSKAPGNLYSTPREITIEAGKPAAFSIELDQVIPPIPEPPTTKYVRHERIHSERLTKFWGRPMYLGAHILVPEGFDAHPDARYPLVINHGHFPDTIGGFRETPAGPEPEARRTPSASTSRATTASSRSTPTSSTRTGRGPTTRGILIVEIQHANPYYDDSYAVNSAERRPLRRRHHVRADPLHREEVPRDRRGLGALHVRRLDRRMGGARRAGVLPRRVQRRVGGLPRSPSTSASTRSSTSTRTRTRTTGTGPGAEVATPAALATTSATSRRTQWSRQSLELVLGTKSRSGGQWDIWEAVYSPVGADGYPQRIWDKRTGSHRHEGRRASGRRTTTSSTSCGANWDKGLGPKLAGKIHIYVGEADNYYLNNAVYLADEFLKSTKNPAYGGVIDYEPRAEHCWNGDHTRPNATSRLRYHQFFAPKIVERILKTAPQGRRRHELAVLSSVKKPGARRSSVAGAGPVPAPVSRMMRSAVARVRVAEGETAAMLTDMG